MKVDNQLSTCTDYASIILNTIIMAECAQKFSYYILSRIQTFQNSYSQSFIFVVSTQH